MIFSVQGITTELVLPEIKEILTLFGLCGLYLIENILHGSWTKTQTNY